MCSCIGMMACIGSSQSLNADLSSGDEEADEIGGGTIQRAGSVMELRARFEKVPSGETPSQPPNRSSVGTVIGASLIDHSRVKAATDRFSSQTLPSPKSRVRGVPSKKLRDSWVVASVLADSLSRSFQSSEDKIKRLEDESKQSTTCSGTSDCCLLLKNPPHTSSEELDKEQRVSLLKVNEDVISVQDEGTDEGGPLLGTQTGLSCANLNLSQEGILEEKPHISKTHCAKAVEESVERNNVTTLQIQCGKPVMENKKAIPVNVAVEWDIEGVAQQKEAQMSTIKVTKVAQQYQENQVKEDESAVVEANVSNGDDDSEYVTASSCSSKDNQIVENQNIEKLLEANDQVEDSNDNDDQDCIFRNPRVLPKSKSLMSSIPKALQEIMKMEEGQDLKGASSSMSSPSLGSHNPAGEIGSSINFLHQQLMELRKQDVCLLKQMMQMDHILQELHVRLFQSHSEPMASWSSMTLPSPSIRKRAPFTSVAELDHHQTWSLGSESSDFVPTTHSQTSGESPTSEDEVILNSAAQHKDKYKRSASVQFMPIRGCVIKE